MNARRPQEIQHERQEAPAGPKLSARRLQEASQNELTQKPSGARELSGAARSRRELSGAVRSRQGAARSCQECFHDSPAYCRPSLGLGNPARAEILEGDVWGALKIEHYVLPV